MLQAAQARRKDPHLLLSSYTKVVVGDNRCDSSLRSDLRQHRTETLLWLPYTGEDSSLSTATEACWGVALSAVLASVLSCNATQRCFRCGNVNLHDVCPRHKDENVEI